MTDFIDRASEQEAQDRKLALQEQARRANLTGKTISDSALECTECAEPIPLNRRLAMPGCQFCISCQTQREKAFYER
ncbi:TraR/DksA C4-type zinc finger protein [Undibacterium sp. Ren11W]|uniref:TraR/DksA C4-type zinc finger protein n=1 Tax=Undibacterium sp. Ren11W TaxID=3413045 RepID=UPI003BEF8F35